MESAVTLYITGLIGVIVLYLFVGVMFRAQRRARIWWTGRKR